VEVAIADYGELSLQDFMVSLYNGHSVQRVRIVAAAGTLHDVHGVLAEAIAALAAA
jgi:hypothetical protein